MDHLINELEREAASIKKAYHTKANARLLFELDYRLELLYLRIAERQAWEAVRENLTRFAETETAKNATRLSMLEVGFAAGFDHGAAHGTGVARGVEKVLSDDWISSVRSSLQGDSDKSNPNLSQTPDTNETGDDRS